MQIPPGGVVEKPGHRPEIPAELARSPGCGAWKRLRLWGLGIKI